MSRMSAREIPSWQWPAFLDQFSRTHRAWLATLDEDDEVPPTAHPLRSVTVWCTSTSGSRTTRTDASRLGFARR